MYSEINQGILRTYLVNTIIMQEHQTQQVIAAQPLWKDLLIPGSIMLAGVAIGLGLYFGGSGGAVQPVAVAPGQPVEEVDTTDQVAEVTDADHRKGAADAQVVVVEYSDFDCPFCSRFHDSMNQIVETNDNVAWVYRHFPLEQLHPLAEQVAMASECVAEISGETAFWSFTDGYFVARGAGDDTEHAALIAQLAQAAGTPTDAFNECMDSGRTQQLVQDDLDNAVATGGRGTPWSIIIGPTGKTYPVNGALPTAAVEQLIQVAIDEA